MSHGRRTNRRLIDRGAAAVEFALVLPILALILFGIVDFGRLLSAKLTLAEAAREGARVQAVTATTAAVLDQVDKVTASLPGPVDPPQITACPVAPLLGDNATVTLTYHFDFVTPVGDLIGLGSGGGMDLEATGVMPCL